MQRIDLKKHLRSRRVKTRPITRGKKWKNKRRKGGIKTGRGKDKKELREKRQRGKNW